MTGSSGNGAGGAAPPGLGPNGAVTFADPETGDVVDLTAWAGRYADRFEAATALAARRPDVFGPRASGVKRHVQCPFAAEHKAPGRDGTYVVDASEVAQAGLTDHECGFCFRCDDNACAGRDRLDFLAAMLSLGWLTAADLSDSRFIADGEASSAVADARARVEGLAERTKADPGAPFEDGTPAALAMLRRLDQAAFQRLWADLRRAGARLRDLDQEVRRTGLRVIAGGAGEDGAAATVQAGPYFVTPAGLTALNKVTGDGVVPVPVANFVARIVAEEVRDDGAERRMTFVVEGVLAGGRTLARIQVPAERFNAMTWTTESWGTEAVIFAGQGTRDHVRAAIQMLSGAVPRRTVYGHLGWRRIDGAWAYLHAGGAIGADGVVEGIEVDAGGDRLEAYALPQPPEGEALREAVRASLGLLDLGPETITAPLLGGVFRAPVGEAVPVDFSIHLAGASGVFKSELAALAQAHFGSGFSGRDLPGSWSDTANALEKKAFVAKDAVFVVDDFKPVGTTADVQRLHREADRLLRAAGNRAGRGRMAADGHLRPTYFPRGLIVSTGEDVPSGQSLRARVLIIEVAKGDVAPDRLTAAQADAAAGRFAAAMAGYVRWLAPRMDDLKAELPERQRALRAEVAREALHRRTPDIVANLLLGWEIFVQFAQEVAAITADEAEALLARARAALAEAAGAQAGQQAGEEPTARFLALLGAAIGSGRGHLADAKTGGPPATAGARGWRERAVGAGLNERKEWAAQGERLGWVDGDDLLLDPDTAYAAVQRLARDQGTTLPITQRMLWKHLADAGLLASREAARQAYTVRRTREGLRRDVLHLRADSLAPGPDQDPTPDHKPDQKNASESEEKRAPGHIGQVGQVMEDRAAPWRAKI